MKVSDFDFSMPERLVATEPAPGRDSSRLMVLNGGASPEHREFPDILEYLHPGDMLLLNDTKVLPYRLHGRKPTGGAVELLLVRDISQDGSGKHWEVLSKGSYTGTLEFTGPLWANVTDGAVAELEYEGELEAVLDSCGEMPLPPYIKRRADERDRKWYQTVYARRPGSIAAPTAGLHFTERVLEGLREKGVLVRELTLHVGVGTFLPIRSELVEEHGMEPERFEIQRALALEINALPGRLITVGTTATRAVEGYFSGNYEPWGEDDDTVRGSTDIFIHPGYEFRAVQGILTNFHLPRSTPLMLASAFCGRRRLLSAYSAAVDRDYRFFSYGDAMLLLKGI
ncbi:MAG: tRNA preQ1(34) S-adenosylmethionine ribosyltransferase-isomerase QueA [Thermodesulfovibrionales bacterium]|nr:tRNA preQ1(34) S-adenosylmethionine ribosyltransferase-isomerase QueA [Thermodesulfovibrionales bacterium]